MTASKRAAKIEVSGISLSATPTRVDFAAPEIYANNIRLARSNELSSAPPYSVFEAFNELISSLNSPHWALVTSGTGAATTPLSSTEGIGIVRFQLGTTATGRAALFSPSTSSTLNNFLVTTRGEMYFRTRLRFEGLSDATNTWSCRVGFISSITTESLDGVFFRYQHTVNSGNWQLVTRNNGAESVINTTVAPSLTANAFQIMEVRIAADGLSAEGFINNVSVGTLNTNLPGGTRIMGYGIMTLRSVGTAATNALLIDYAYVRCVWSNAR